MVSLVLRTKKDKLKCLMFSAVKVALLFPESFKVHPYKIKQYIFNEYYFSLINIAASIPMLSFPFGVDIIVIMFISCIYVF